MSLWEAVNSLRTQVSSVTGGLDKQERHLAAFKTNEAGWKANFNSLSVSYLRNLPSIKAYLEGLKDRILLLEAKTKALPTPQNASPILNPPLGHSGPSVHNKVGGTPGVTQPDFEALKLNVKNALEEVRTSILDLKSSGTSASNNTSGDASTAGLRVEFNRVLERLSEIEGRGAGETVTIDGQVFCSQGEVKEWLDKNGITGVGVFWDLFSVMCCMRPKKHTGKERSDETYSAHRTHSTTLGNDLCAAMSHLRPEVLYAKRGTGSLEPLENGFGACASFRQWGLGSESYKKQLSTMLDKFISGVLGNMATHGPARQLANALMANVRMQWSNMCTYIDSFYGELTGEAAFDPTKAWKLVGRCVGTLFAALDPYRAPVSMLESLGTADNQAACLWAVLQCHRVGQVFDLVDYRGHPAVVAEMSLFMMTERVDPDQITICIERSKKAEKEASDAKSENAKLKDVLVVIQRDLKAAQGEIRALKARN
jgi:hypothetical protein